MSFWFQTPSEVRTQPRLLQLALCILLMVDVTVRVSIYGRILSNTFLFFEKHYCQILMAKQFEKKEKES